MAEFDDLAGELLEGVAVRWRLLASAEVERREAVYAEADLDPALSEYMEGRFALTGREWRHRALLLAREHANGVLGAAGLEGSLWALYVEMAEQAEAEFYHYIDLRLRGGACVVEGCECGMDYRAAEAVREVVGKM